MKRREFLKKSGAATAAAAIAPTITPPVDPCFKPPTLPAGVRTYAASDPLTNKLWSMKLGVESIQQTFVARTRPIDNPKREFLENDDESGNSGGDLSAGDPD